ncbi:glycosyltransferase [Microbacterium sp. NPDC058389]|uniref:glycosyltransferase n=1 Tax=Microbacterium sp. NPDC058389 TaxID=3346475 RepID=UPI00366849C0
MSPAPLVSIVMPVFDDESTVAAALQSALDQSLRDIEVICVDDASTDGTPAIIESFVARDPRVRLIRQDRNQSAFQSRRVGILAAEAAYVLFLDGDDELVVDAAEKALAQAEATRADLVGFGVTVVEKSGRTGGAYENRLRHAHQALTDGAVLQGLFPIGAPAQGQLWRYLFRTSLLRHAYSLVPEDLSLPRVNDLPLLFLAAASATKLVAIPDKLYRYHYGRGGSGQAVDSVERAEFYASAIRSIDSIRPAIESLALERQDADSILATYESARLSIIAHVCFQLVAGSDSSILDAALGHLQTLTSTRDIIRAAATFRPATLSTLRFHLPWQGDPDRPVRSILLATSSLRTGGVSAVLTSQARALRDSGCRVTIVARNRGSDRSAVPAGVDFVELAGRDLDARLREWSALCRSNEIDLVIDHQLLYTDQWPEYALAARAEGAATIGWVHNFVGRPLYDGNRRLSLLERCSNTLARLIVLSPLDVAYFKLRGVAHTSFLPNPPSPLLLESSSHSAAKTRTHGRIDLVWWGRLEQRTKQISELIDVGVQLRKLRVDFRLQVIGPDWDDSAQKRFNAEARRRGVGDVVVAVGPRHGRDLIDLIDAADAFVSTSIIEGYQLTIAEAQARGLPVFMYELPWLTLAQDNAGIVTAPQGDAPALARAIAQAVEDPDRYAELSASSVDAARRALSYDFAALYRDVAAGTLPPEFSPEPSLDDARELLRLLVFFAERGRGAGRAPNASLSARLWRSAAPLGRATLRRFPRLRPLADRAKGLLRAR